MAWETILDFSNSIAFDGAGNVYVTGLISDNAFKITPDGLITEIIDATGDGIINLDYPVGIAVTALAISISQGIPRVMCLR